MSRDPFRIDPESSTNFALKNKLGIREPDRVTASETRFADIRLQQVAAGGGPHGPLNAAYLKAVHRFIFQDVYEWAGKTRGEPTTIDGVTFKPPASLSKGGSSFLASPRVEGALSHLMDELAVQNHFRGLPRITFAEKAADFFGDLNYIHPFREGNGRVQRAFVSELARRAGHTLDFGVISQERMIQASIDSHHGRPEMMRRMFDEISTPSRVAALKRAVNFLEVNGFDWNSRYVATTTPGQRYVGVFVSRGGEDFMMHDRQQILIGRTADLEKPPKSGAEIVFQATAERARDSKTDPSRQPRRGTPVRNGDRER